jgi:hypothetical protein
MLVFVNLHIARFRPSYGWLYRKKPYLVKGVDKAYNGYESDASIDFTV